MTKRIAATYEFLNEGDTLTEAFITALEDEEKQEICHSLNRRTEFKVLRTTYKLFDSPSKSVKKELTDSVQSAVDEKTVGDSGDEMSGGTAAETGGTVGANAEKPEKLLRSRENPQGQRGQRGQRGHKGPKRGKLRLIHRKKLPT